MGMENIMSIEHTVYIIYSRHSSQLVMDVDAFASLHVLKPAG